MSSALLHDAIGILATFGVECIYSPKGGGTPRTITADVAENGTFQDDRAGLASQETLSACVLRDKDHETHGGIDDPQLGDGFRLASDPEGKGFSWQGEKRDVDEYSWTLVFARNITVRHR